MPYRIDIPHAGDHAFDRLVELGALDAERSHDGTLAALMPDSIPPEQVARMLGVARIAISPAEGRDAGSVWVLQPRAVRVGSVRIVPAHTGAEADPEALRMIDAAAFGTGLHPTTALCLEAIEDAVSGGVPETVLDVGTGSGVLALAALRAGVPRALGIDIDDEALRVAAANARLNELGERLELRHGGPDALTGMWPLVLANVLAAPLIEMAPALVRRLGRRGRLVLSGMPASLQQDVSDTYCRLGMRHVRALSREGWVALVLRTTW